MTTTVADNAARHDDHPREEEENKQTTHPESTASYSNDQHIA